MPASSSPGWAPSSVTQTCAYQGSRVPAGGGWLLLSNGFTTPKVVDIEAFSFFFFLIETMSLIISCQPTAVLSQAPWWPRRPCAPSRGSSSRRGYVSCWNGCGESAFLLVLSCCLHLHVLGAALGMQGPQRPRTRVLFPLLRGFPCSDIIILHDVMSSPWQCCRILVLSEGEQSELGFLRTNCLLFLPCLARTVSAQPELQDHLRRQRSSTEHILTCFTCWSSAKCFTF